MSVCAGFSPSTWSTHLLFPVWFRKMNSTRGGAEWEREAEEKCVCLIGSLLASQPILRTWAGMWVGFVILYSVFGLLNPLFWPFLLVSVWKSCAYWGYKNLFLRICSNILVWWLDAFCVCVWCVCVVFVQGSICWQRPRGLQSAVGTEQCPKGVIKTRKHAGDKHTHTSSLVILILKGNCHFIQKGSYVCTSLCL